MYCPSQNTCKLVQLAQIRAAKDHHPSYQARNPRQLTARRLARLINSTAPAPHTHAWYHGALQAAFPSFPIDCSFQKECRVHLHAGVEGLREVGLEVRRRAAAQPRRHPLDSLQDKGHIDGAGGSDAATPAAKGIKLQRPPLLRRLVLRCCCCCCCCHRCRCAAVLGIGGVSGRVLIWVAPAVEGHVLDCTALDPAAEGGEAGETVGHRGEGRGAQLAAGAPEEGGGSGAQRSAVIKAEAPATADIEAGGGVRG
jgi:hypothetical protein